MKAVEAATLSVIILLVAACGAVERPSSLKELANLQTSKNATLAQKASPGAFEEGLKYLKLSNEAIEERDSKKADRLASLGIIQLKIAFAGAARLGAQENLEAASKKKQLLETELEQARSSLEKIETLVERRKLRNQLEELVTETRELAAAEEHQREQTLSTKDMKALEKARRELGLEILSRVEVWTSVLEVFASKGILERDRLAILEGEKILAKSAFEELDLATVQEHVEQVGIKARRLINEAWSGKDEQRAEIRSLIEEQLKTLEIENVREDFGLISVVTFPSLKKLKSSKEYKTLKSTWETNENIHLVPLAMQDSALLLVIPIP